ncbi:hypothetical protein CC78DRAFT_584903 [Lojkania enalia]|uniref:Extracellular membrane protein CFEM domain-containing protein n=1 Tax=Lojkania enalia TaxID=147567 RepID=A0A9P4K2Z0_9PLEO|nr:hypothetical protein CC78DRAFT_584903 [Didymosphaeria enalia]
MRLVYVLACAVSFSKAGFVPPAEWCLPSAHLKELSGCISMTDFEDECDAKPSNDERLDCYCRQEVLSSYFACKDDITRCLETHRFDPQFDEKVKRWHEACDERITTSLTTPVVTSLTATYDFGACQRLHESCLSADYETNRCSETYLPTSSMSFLSCCCQPPIYSLVSECQFNGNISCKRTSAAESNIMGYSYCSYFWSGSETLSSVDFTSVLGDVGRAATAAAMISSYSPIANAASVASIIRSTIPQAQERARQTSVTDSTLSDMFELK